MLAIRTTRLNRKYCYLFSTNVRSDQKAYSTSIGKNELINYLPLLNFQESKTGDFLQEPPSLGNQYEDDNLLKSYFKRIFPSQVGNFLVYFSVSVTNKDPFLLMIVGTWKSTVSVHPFSPLVSEV